MVILQGKEEQLLDSKETKVQHKLWTSLCWGGGKARMLPMITQIIEGQGWYFSSWIQLISWMSSECWRSRNLCRESSRRCNRSATTSSQSNDEVKGYWNQGYDTNSKPSLLFKAKWYDDDDRRKVSSSSKIVLWEEGPGSTVKISSIMI